jgi:NADPH-dependent glutamate synthase beta subunit-like oxidoreductase
MVSYQVFLPDFKFYQQSVACQFACPVRTDGRAYVNAIAKGEYERAYLIARETNPFASTCGWVCGAPCEAACRRGKIDAPIAIRALKRFVNDKYGVYLGETGESRRPPSWPAYVGRTDAHDLGNTIFPSGRSELSSAYERGDQTSKRIAIVGAGPAGLSCAHDLALLGHEITIFDSAPKAGGMLRLLADLRKEFDAVFIAIGTYQSRNLNVEGEQFDGVLRAVDFLINVNLGGYNLDLGKKVLVIGGGNVAMDVARTATRLGHPAQSGGDLEMALDVARTAVRLGSTQEVNCLVVESREEMLADPIEIIETQEEGVIIHNHLAPKSILGVDGHAVGVETSDVSRAFDDQGRFNPQLVPNSDRVWECDSVIVAIGQSGDLDWVIPEDGLEITPRGTLQVDEQTLTTTAEGVYAGGDIAFGPRLIINAVADGQRAASNIHAYLQNVQPHYVRRGYFSIIPKDKYPDAGPCSMHHVQWLC